MTEANEPEVVAEFLEEGLCADAPQLIRAQHAVRGEGDLAGACDEHPLLGKRLQRRFDLCLPRIDLGDDVAQRIKRERLLDHAEDIPGEVSGLRGREAAEGAGGRRPTEASVARVELERGCAHAARRPRAATQASPASAATASAAPSGSGTLKTREVPAPSAVQDPSSTLWYTTLPETTVS